MGLKLKKDITLELHAVHSFTAVKECLKFLLCFILDLSLVNVHFVKVYIFCGP
jgi:hypothetical protein